ncbi:hypothetical protein [Oceanirhabdus sp. W0125-5]|uniref:hypothetical protein n=1 Tax=Oceanirhabdus sp. W0125-5 TaxID=2999116 RepID=UPI0022F2C631|nr:hypothetical protein [Oceanirhabdus sp. W0125-5]WBW99487.1 hypothetical protein OW730_12285 [Oceanirhabdus sp. W0125-5]
MIKDIEVINQPISGCFEERVYDIESAYKSLGWTWLKFTNDDYSEWCGEFRGRYIAHGISKKYESILVLTSDCLHQLSIHDGTIQYYEDSPQYRNLTVTPMGEYIASDYYCISILGETINDVQYLETPLKLDMIEFKTWEGFKLKITGDEFINWDNHVELELDCRTMCIEIKKQNK